MRTHVHLGLEEPTAEPIAALDAEVYVAPLDHELLFEAGIAARTR
jgi:hypothetical protein